MRIPTMKKLICLAALLFAFATPAFAQDTLFADMGGKAGIDKLVDVFVDNYLADPRVKATFDESNMDRVRAKMKEQFCMVAGGPCAYTGHSMEAAHKGLHLTNADFNAVVENLQDAMDTCGIAFSVQNRFLARMAPMEHQVVTK
jgi:hemoglobin